MFERYTERARRVIFFGRYEASQYGSHTIETEHLLLGLIREDKNLVNRFLADSPETEGLRKKIEGLLTIHEKVPVSSDLPLSNECKLILARAAEEAERLNHRHIGTEHLLLGILRDPPCTAAIVLSELGLELNSARAAVSTGPEPPSPTMPLPAAGVVPDADTAKRIAEAVWDRNSPEVTKATNAVLTHGVWLVTGSRTTGDKPVTLAAFIQEEDGKILRIHQE